MTSETYTTKTPEEFDIFRKGISKRYVECGELASRGLDEFQLGRTRILVNPNEKKVMIITEGNPDLIEKTRFQLEEEIGVELI